MYIVKTEIKNSRIHGKGYFANEDIPLGTIVNFHGLEDIVYNKKDYEVLDPKEKK